MVASVHPKPNLRMLRVIYHAKYTVAAQTLRGKVHRQGLSLKNILSLDMMCIIPKRAPRGR